MQLPQSSNAMDGRDLRSKREQAFKEIPKIPEKAEKPAQITVQVEKTVAKNGKRKRDSSEEVPTSPPRKVKVIRQNFTNCKLCNESFPTSRCEEDTKGYKQFCATCLALK